MFDYYFRPEKVAIFAREKYPANDTIIVPLAFGRNTWNDGEVSHHLSEIRFSDADSPLTDITAFEELGRQDFDPGEVNHRLADICYELFDSREGRMCFIYGQWEVMYALYQKHTLWYRTRKFPSLKAIWPKENGEYLSTRGVLDQLPRGIPVALVAQAVHMARCLRVADQVLGDEYVSKAPAQMPNIYDPSSTQEQTRDSEGFIAFERQVRIFEELPKSLQKLARRILGK